MKKLYIIHRWDGEAEGDWYPWLKTELEKKFGTDLPVQILAMPNSAEPVIAEWVDYLTQAVPSPDAETYFVGHSIGCQAIMHYLESLDNIKIGGALFVAGWFKLANLEDEAVEQIAAPWLNTPINFEKVKATVGSNLRVLLSDDDPYNCVEENATIFQNQLGAEVSIEQSAGHFTEKEYPVILNKFQI